jgi:(5-formylfuran-3-yl)methyl phosphate synthase
VSQLLVSVQNAKEAKRAIMAGAGLIDAKSPANGPLGRCDEATWRAIQAVVQNQVPLSAALGEWTDWCQIDETEIRGRLAPLAGFTYAKIGPSGSADRISLWSETLTRLQRLAPETLKWIAVVYADNQAANSLSREQLLDFAIQNGCHGLLIDTFDKSKPNIWRSDWNSFIRKVQKSHLKIALAGGLNAQRISQLQDLDPEWFAVRGSACKTHERTSRISFRNVHRLVRNLEKFNLNPSNGSKKAPI